jgi:hypothetical protein
MLKRINHLILAFCILVTPALAKNLVPEKPGTAPNYWCTWAAQNYMHGQGLKELDPSVLEGNGGAALARDSLNEKVLLGPEGWAAKFYLKCRSDLLLVLDDGWDVPSENPGPWFSSCLLNKQKFPSFAALKPAERLKKLNDAVKAAGWRGIGLWLASQESAAARGNANDEQYWIDRMRWCREAGIEYWKVDWGAKDNDSFRRFLTDLARKEHPQLIMEHAVRHGPFNEMPKVAAGWVDACTRQAAFADIVRLYDLSPQLSVPAMLDRVARVLAAVKDKPSTAGLLNCDDEPYIAAGLGVCMGVLRHPMTGLRPSGDPDVFFSGPRQQKKRTDEVTRATRWQRIAPPWSVGIGNVALDEKLLSDSWQFKRGDFWTGIGRLIKQNAPARVARGLPLPEVKADGEQPYIIASRHPNGAVSVAALGRMLHEKGWSEPEADVTLQVGKLPPAIGVFGRYRSLTLVFDALLTRGRLWAQDLAGDEAQDVTDQVKINGNRLILSGKLINKYGLAAATSGDVSGPGLVLVFEQAAPLAIVPNNPSSKSVDNQSPRLRESFDRDWRFARFVWMPDGTKRSESGDVKGAIQSTASRKEKHKSNLLEKRRATASIMPAAVKFDDSEYRADANDRTAHLAGCTVNRIECSAMRLALSSGRHARSLYARRHGLRRHLCSEMTALLHPNSH